MTVQPSTAIGGCVSCGVQRRHGPDRAARLRRPAREPPSRSMPAADRIPTNERLGDPCLHGRTAGTPRGTTGLLAHSRRGAARRPDCAPRPADRAERRLCRPGDCADLVAESLTGQGLWPHEVGTIRAAHGLAPEVQTEIRGKPLIGVPGQAIHANACGCRESRPRSCGERVFVDDAAGAVVPSDSEGVEVGDGRWCRLEGCRLVEGSVWAVLVVMSFVFAENPQ